MIETIDQQVIDDNKEIFATILTELQKAEFEILIATAWFTDDELFAVLLNKIAKGVHIEVIVADNQENEKLDFNLLVAKGAIVHKIKNIGYGIMNQKFCVIDKRIALHGSYNWTVNAKKNNHESIISTNHEQTVQSLISNFNGIKNRISELKGESVDTSSTVLIPERPKALPITMPLNARNEFEMVLDSMIAAEVGSFDRKLLREQGFDRCLANNGDHQVLHKAFDTLYSMFINDIDVIEDKKKRLLTKIEEQRTKNLDNLNNQCAQRIDHAVRESELKKSALESKLTTTETEIDINAKDIEELRDSKIPYLEERNIKLDEQIKTGEREFITPKIRWFELIPTAVFGLTLLIYLFLFYSSAAYILLFSVADAKEAQAAGAPIAEAQIFNPDAMSRAFEKSGTAPYFIFLFVFIPLTFAAVDRFVKPEWANLASWLSILFGIILLDGAVAYKVTQVIYEVNYARGNVNIPWEKSMAFTDTNFYLVFVFGAFGLLLFKLCFKKLISIFEDRNPDILTQRNAVLMKQLLEEIAVNEEKITALKEEMTEFERKTIHLKADIKQIQQDIADSPILLNQEQERLRSQLNTDTKTIDQIAAIYTTHIQSDNLPLSVDALKDRINIFLEGWNDCLHDEYSVPRAIAKTADAAAVAVAWQNDKLQAGKIDKRVKVNNHE